MTLHSRLRGEGRVLRVSLCLSGENSTTKFLLTNNLLIQIGDTDVMKSIL